MKIDLKLKESESCQDRWFHFTKETLSEINDYLVYSLEWLVISTAVDKDDFQRLCKLMLEYAHDTKKILYFVNMFTGELFSGIVSELKRKYFIIADNEMFNITFVVASDEINQFYIFNDKIEAELISETLKYQN